MNKNSRPWTINQMVKMVTNGTLVFDNAIQRSFVWDKKRSSLLIDSFLRDYPVPAFYAITDGRKITTPKGEVSVYDCLDGKQRCTTLYKFFNNEFTLTGLEPFMTSEGEVDINGMTYEELPEELQDTLKNAHMVVYSFDDATENDITEIMSRPNNGKPLSAIDNTRIKARDLNGIKELAMNSFFTDHFTDKAMDGHQNEEIVVKTYIHLYTPESGLDNKDVRPIYESLVITDEIKERLTLVFDNLNNIVTTMLNSKSPEEKKVAKKLLKKTHLISVTSIIDRAIKDDREPESVIDFLYSFFGEGSPSMNDDYNAACNNGVNHADKVIARGDALEEHYNWYYSKGEEISAEEETEEYAMAE